MKTQIEFITRSQAVAQGFNFAGTTTDETMLKEITRDYLAQGYSEVKWTRGAGGTFIYWTKHPAINPSKPATATVKRAGVETETLAEPGIHTVARITNDGDDSEPPTLCDTSLIQITDDAGQDFVLLAMELDAVARAWLKLRKK